MAEDSKYDFLDGDSSDLVEWMSKFFKARREARIPLGQKGTCAVCQAESVLRCQNCLNLYQIDGRRAPFYCSVEHQKIHWKKGHKKACRPGEGAQSVFGLVYAVSKDYLPKMGSNEYNDYGFGNCKTLAEECNLMGIYIGLIDKLECDIDDLHEACMNGRLDKFIIAEFERNIQDPNARGKYYTWFLDNQDICKYVIHCKIW